MEAIETLLLFDYYGDMLTDRQKMCLDYKYNQDMFLISILNYQFPYVFQFLQETYNRKIDNHIQMPYILQIYII